MKKSNAKVKLSNFAKKIKKYKEVFIGMDVDSGSYHMAVFTHKDEIVAWTAMSANNEAVVNTLAPVKKRVKRIVYEAGPTGFGLARVLTEAGFCVDVIAPSSTPKPPTAESKTDPIDCRKLAEFNAKDLLKPVLVPTRQQEAERQILRGRNLVRQNLTRVMTRIKLFLMNYSIPEIAGAANWTRAYIASLRSMELNLDLRFHLDGLLAEYDFHKQQISKYVSRLRQISKRPKHRKACEHLQEISGVGVLTAITFILEIIIPERFPDERKFSRYVGLSPRLHQSGQTSRSKGITTSGNRRLRHILIEAAWRWKLKDPRAKRIYGSHYNKMMKPQKAIAATARKLGVIMWRMLVTGEHYRPSA